MVQSGVDVSELTRRFVAHKGLHGEGAPENSLLAVRRAVEEGFAVEVDVHLTLEGEVVVLHDHTLTRMCQRSERVEVLTRSLRSVVYLSASDQTIPSLEEVLAEVGGRVPLFLDLKPRQSWQILSRRSAVRLARAVGEKVAGYSGVVGVMSWDPRQLRWFEESAPQVVRIQSGGAEILLLPGMARAFDRLYTARFSHPHLVSYNAALLPNPSVERVRRQGVGVLAWTVRSEGALERVLPYADGAIFEGFTPERSTTPALRAVVAAGGGWWRRSVTRAMGPGRAVWAMAWTQRLILLATLVGASVLGWAGGEGDHLGSVALMLAAVLGFVWPRRWVGAALLGVVGACFGLSDDASALASIPVWAVVGAFLGSSIRAVRRLYRG